MIFSVDRKLTVGVSPVVEDWLTGKIPGPKVVLSIEIPALTQLLDYVTSQEQAKVDALTGRLKAVNARMAAALAADKA